MQAKLYISKSLPDHWVGSDIDGSLWIFPARYCGWAERTPYCGHDRALQTVDPINATGTGWPCEVAS